MNLLECDEMVVYGAGMLANLVYTYLNMQLRGDNIKYFVVTCRDNNKKTLFDKPVITADEAIGAILESNMPVVIAIGEKNSKSVIEMLRRNGISDIIALDSGLKQRMRSEIWEFYSRYPLENKVFFSSFMGKVYADNPKYIALKMFETYGERVKLVWNFSNNHDMEVPCYIKKVYKDSPDFFYEFCTSKVIVTNGSFPYMNKRNGVVAIGTWHGFGFKRVGINANSYDEKAREGIVSSNRNIDIYISNTDNYQKIFRESFASNAPIYDFGSPRNDILFDKAFDRRQVYEALGIDASKKIVLYAPTFRDDVAASFEKYIIDCDKILKALEHRFGGEYAFVYRFHHMLYEKVKNDNYFKNGINATFYPDTQELLAAADVLISDYSSIMWDFSLQRRPVFMLHNDVDEYADDRGFYTPPETWPYERAFDNDDLCRKILGFDREAYLARLEKFIQDNKSYDDGHASERCCDLIMNIIQHPEAYEYKRNV